MMVVLPADLVAAPTVEAAERAFRKGRLEDARFLLDRVRPDSKTEARAHRLRIFLALASGQSNLFDRLSAQGNPDPVLAYVMALRRLSLRDFDGAYELFPVVLRGQSASDLRQSPGVATAFLPLPFACGTEAGWQALLSDRRRIIRLYDGSLGSLELAAVYFLWHSRTQKAWKGLYSGKELPSPATDLTSFILQPDKEKLLRCTALIHRHRPESARNQYRILFDLLMHIDDSPASYRQIAHRYLSDPVADDGSAVLALEALHALRAGLDRLPPLQAVPSSHLTTADRKAIEERLLLYRLMQQAYARLNRSSHAHQLAAVAAVLERYISGNHAFPLKELRDRTGENLHHRESLVLRMMLSAEDEQKELYRRLSSYDDRHPEEHPLIFRRIYRYR